MALADYYLCDRCSAKTFYDAELDYPTGLEALHMEKMWPTGVGCMKVLCRECAKNNVVIIRPIPTPPREGEAG